MKKITLTLAAVSILGITGCVNQQQADTKMGEGCKAAIEAMIEPKKLLETKSINYSDEQTEGSLYRRVTVTAVEKDGWVEVEKKYKCLFAQQWGLFKSSHTALLEQLSVGDQFWGKKDGKIIGSMEDFMKMTGKADTVMGQ
jgi:uncharacterized lipoprotein NlpE involved in copper resistance